MSDLIQFSTENHLGPLGECRLTGILKVGEGSCCTIDVYQRHCRGTPGNFVKDRLGIQTGMASIQGWAPVEDLDPTGTVA